MSEEKSKLIQITGLWENKKADGSTYFSGYLGGASIVIFKNGYKTETKHPDWVMYVGESKKRQATTTEPTASPSGGDSPL